MNPFQVLSLIIDQLGIIANQRAKEPNIFAPYPPEVLAQDWDLAVEAIRTLASTKLDLYVTSNVTKIIRSLDKVKIKLLRIALKDPEHRCDEDYSTLFFAKTTQAKTRLKELSDTFYPSLRASNIAGPKDSHQTNQEIGNCPNGESPPETTIPNDLGTIDEGRMLWVLPNGKQVPISENIIPAAKAMVEKTPFEIPSTARAYSSKSPDAPRNLCKALDNLIDLAQSNGFPYPEEWRPSRKKNIISFTGKKRRVKKGKAKGKPTKKPG